MAKDERTMEQPKDSKLRDVSSNDFVGMYLPLYSGPQVKALLCKNSRYFAKMLDDPWKEGQVNTVTMDELDGVVSVRSFKLLIQWCYVGRIVVGTATPSEEIEALIEFARLADFCQVEGTEELVAERIKVVILAHPAPKDTSFPECRHPDTNTYSIMSRAVLWASGLPKDHAVRKMLATAAVEGYLRHAKHEHKFFKETQEIPNFGIDVLNAVKACLSTLSASAYGVVQFTDPISGIELVVGY
ncbi:hypothetical protein N431DRAFT_490654 [Stipitochalara longipes BDJ]|nr:hypothetical protein N431DRAFT_490654 [Stipitochalara longipes BDJ]